MAAEPQTPARHEPSTREVRLLHRISTDINAAASEGRVLDVAMDSLRELFGLEDCAAFQLEGTCLVLTASRGELAGAVRRRTRMGSGIVGAAAAKGEIVRLNFAPQAPLPSAPGQIESRIAIPMLAQETLVGVLFARRKHESVLRKSDETLATIVANHTAVALQNAQLYEGLRRMNEELEERVKERTAELERKHRELQDAQAQLVHSGKMAALGQLAAGLAHEMNTPLGAISSNVDVTQRALSALQQAQEEQSPTPASARRVGRALDALERTVGVSREACDRVFSIFATLRSFARLDEAQLQWTDLSEGLDSTLELLAHRFEEGVELRRDYQALPPVLCKAGELNQVFLIVLTNAVEAIEGRGSVTVRTRAAGAELRVEVEDTGCGIAKEELARVFDPGFTTKGVRVGTGLSLGIAFRIMEAHGGGIELQSEAGQGTCVHLRLPLEPR